MDTPWQEVVFQNGLAQEVVALFGSIATERRRSSHLVHRLVHGLDNGWAERLGDIAYPQRDDVGLGMRHLESVHFLSDIRKQVVVWQFQKMLIY